MFLPLSKILKCIQGGYDKKQAIDMLYESMMTATQKEEYRLAGVYRDAKEMVVDEIISTSDIILADQWLSVEEALPDYNLIKDLEKRFIGGKMSPTGTFKTEVYQSRHDGNIYLEGTFICPAKENSIKRHIEYWMRWPGEFSPKPVHILPSSRIGK